MDAIGEISVGFGVENGNQTHPPPKVTIITNIFI